MRLPTQIRRSAALSVTFFATLPFVIGSCNDKPADALSSPFVLRTAVAETRDAQRTTAVSLGKALDQLRTKYPRSSTELEKQYLQVRKRSQELNGRIEALAQRRDNLRSVCDAVFAEWAQEVDGISTEALKGKSKAKLDATRESLSKLMKQLDESFSKTSAASTALQDYVTYTKHCLNAESIRELAEPAAIGRDLEAAHSDLERSIQQAEEFLRKRSEL